MRRVALKIAYLGTDYYGFQRQPGLTTVEGEILSALEELDVVEDMDNCSFQIAGRTDRGVHALGNVISFLTEGRVIINQINDVLPRSIRILAQTNVPLNFRARYAQNRHYRYLLVAEPFWDGDNLEFHDMVEAAKLFTGTHNFRNFSKRSERNPVRTIESMEIRKYEDLMRVDVIGESFLWNMVRKIVSVLLMVGEGEINPEDIVEYLNPHKEFPIRPAPPEGLILMDVKYSGMEFTEDSYAINSFRSFLLNEFIKSRTITLSQMEMIKALKD